jgi:hypothetical protein
MNYTPRPGLNVPIITVLDDSGKVIADQQRQVIRHVVQNGYGAIMRERGSIRSGELLLARCAARIKPAYA